MAENTNIELDDIQFIRNLGGYEDLEFGIGSITQIRNGINVVVTKINAYNIPYDNDFSIGEMIDKIIAANPIGN